MGAQPVTSTTRSGHKRPAIKQHKEMLLDKRYHHKAEASRKARNQGEVERLYQLELKEFLSEQSIP